MEKYTVLVCDDNEAIRKSLDTYLREEGYDVILAHDGESALRLLERHAVDVVLLDVMLPGIDGYEVCRELRKHSDVYIIMLSARAQELDRVVGLEVGADDYVTKPFYPREILIRIRKAMKRQNPKQETKKFTLAELTVYPESFQAFVDGQEIRLSSKEMAMLTYMLSNEGKVMTREHILDAVWGYEYVGDSRVIDGMVKRLRHKLMKDGVHFAIQTIYGVGYKIEEIR